MVVLVLVSGEGEGRRRGARRVCMGAPTEGARNTDPPQVNTRKRARRRAVGHIAWAVIAFPDATKYCVKVRRAVAPPSVASSASKGLWCQNCVTVVLELFYSCVTVVLELCNSGVTEVLQQCYSAL
jgi:hypothetical protein